MLTNEQLAEKVDACLGERVTIDGIKARIASTEFMSLPNSTVTICNITLDNGYSVRGESACVDPANFSQEIGERYAYDDAFDKLWPLFGLLLAEKRYKNRHVGCASAQTAGTACTGGAFAGAASKTMTFGTAIAALKAGERVARSGWNGKGMWLRMVKPGYYDVGCSVLGGADTGISLSPWIGLKHVDNGFVPWQPSIGDVLAEDWQVVE